MSDRIRSSAYIHVPFCRAKCPYCDFYSEPFGDSEIPSRRYLDAILNHLAWWRQNHDWNQLEAIYFGGGTPSLMPVGFFEGVLGALSKWPGIKSNAEVTIEANPENVSSVWAKDAATVGVNRIVVGVQSFSDRNLKKIGRRYSSKDALAAVAICQDQLRNVGLDLMFGLPGQGLADVEEDLKWAMTLNPSHLSVYQLTVLLTDSKWRGFQMPSEESLLSMFKLGARMLGRAGYDHYEISNFARRGFECRHHINCWSYGEYMGLGAGAASFVIDSPKPFEGRRWKIACDLKSFMEGNLCEIESEKINPDMAMREFLMLGLRMMSGISLSSFKSLFGIDAFCAFPKAKEAVDQGWLESKGDFLRFTPKGLLVSDGVMKILFGH